MKAIWPHPALLALLLNGCSFVFMNAPPSAKEQEAAQEEGGRRPQSDCTTSRTAPIVDTVIGGYQVFRTGYALSADNSAYEGAPISRETDVAMGIGLATLFVGSAVYGYVSANRCEEWKAQRSRVWSKDDEWVE